MSAFVIILAYILAFLFFIWFFTCTEHKELPLIVVILDIIFTCIPGLNIAFAIGNFLIVAILIDEKLVTLKNNWFNRTFLAYNE